MRARTLLAVAVMATSAFAAPAHAHNPTPPCAPETITAPFRVDQQGPDLVKANYAISNYCDTTFVIEAILTADVECWENCPMREYARNTQTVPPNSEGAADITAACLNGPHDYQLSWRVSYFEVEIAHGSTGEVTLDCDSAAPPPDPNLDAWCAKVPEPCKLIRP